MGAFIVMSILAKKCSKHITLIGISVAGALASNIIQILLAIVFVFGMQAWIITPYLLSLGLISGTVIGIFSQYYWNSSRTLHKILQQYTTQQSIKNRIQEI